MDYVVFGIGFGATILVLGLLIRDMGPGLRYRTPGSPDGVFHAEELVAKVSWTRFARALGAVLAIGGVAFLIVTVACMVLMVSDGTGGWVMLGSLVACLLIIMFWTWAFFDRFGSYGILPERGEETDADQVVVAPAPAADLAADRDDERQPARRKPVVVSGPPAPESDATPVDGRGAADETPRVAEGAADVQTPEERLAGMQSPIEHGSAEDGLDIAAAGSGRPRRSRPLPEPERRSVSTGSDSAAPDSAGGDEEAAGAEAPERGDSETR